MTVWGEGPLGDAVRASAAERLGRFIRDEESEAAAIFSAKAREVSDSGDWYGEHLGKWLVAVAAPEDPSVKRIVAFLARCQEPNGYLGTYATEAKCRFTHPEASQVRTWDLWVHAWLILGLLRVGQIEMARRAGDLILDTFPSVHPSILDLGNHAGLSSSVLLQPLAELTEATGDPRYVDLALATLRQMEERGLPLLSASERDVDVAEIGTGKAYQICWTLVGLVAVARVAGDHRLLRSAEALWANIAEHHLTPMGGPWGGIAGHKEVFNARGFFSPYGMVETCSASSWMTLNRALFAATGDERYVAAYERTLLNTILGAIDANGRDWCYFTFPNGRRNNTYHWACCKSSGAMALQEAASMAVTNQDGLSVNLLLPARTEFGGFVLRQEGDPAPTGSHAVIVERAPEEETTLALRIPAWSRLRSVRLNGIEESLKPEGGYLRWTRTWKDGDRIEIDLDVPIQVHPKTFTVDHHGQEIVRTDYACLSRGPYIYATGPFDGFRKEETLRLARLTPEAPFRLAGGAINLHLPGREPIPFLPYYEAGGRHEGAWRTTWLQVAWQ
ncbi:MAG: beta-L-arabinofuranosidase domain-containing protein [Fimbriimonas sp.]